MPGLDLTVRGVEILTKRRVLHQLNVYKNKPRRLVSQRGYFLL
jgi:hypothetical protein